MMEERMAKIKQSLIVSVGKPLLKAIRKPRQSPRTILVLALTGVLCIGIVAAATVFFTTSTQTDIKDPIDRRIVTWQGGTEKNVTISNKNSQSNYVLQMELINYSGLTGQDAVAKARQTKDKNDYIHRILITNHSKGVQEMKRRDLLTDGRLTYLYVPAGGKLSIEIYADSDGAVNITRTTNIPNEVSVRVHRSAYTEKCGNCHNASAPLLCIMK
ncbi:MAG: hypothetical protein ABEI86_03030 [Halobacteriaceae archaeon]